MTTAEAPISQEIPILQSRWDGNQLHDGTYEIAMPDTNLLREASVGNPDALLHLDYINTVHYVDNMLRARDEARRTLFRHMMDLGVLGNEDVFNPEDVADLKDRFNGSHESVIQYLRLTQEEKTKVQAIKDASNMEVARIKIETNQLSGEISNVYTFADQKTQQEGLFASMDDRVRARLSQFGNRIQIVSDVDKTVTDGDAITKGKGDGYLGALPGSIQAEAYMAHKQHKRKTFPETFVAYWNDLLDDPITEPIFHYVGKHIHIREGAPELFQATMDQNIPVTLLSAQFKPVIDGVEENLPVGSITETYAVEKNNIFSTQKEAIVVKQACKAQENEDFLRAVVYIGDGDSDLPAMTLEARAVVGVYFALEGGSFAAELKKAGLPFYTYNTFTEIQNKLVELGILAA